MCSASIRPDLSTLRTNILTHLASAITAAADQLHLAATGRSTFKTDVDFRAAAALLRTLPLLPLLPPTKHRAARAILGASHLHHHLATEETA